MVIIVEVCCYYGHQNLQIPLVTLFYYWKLVSVVIEHRARSILWCADQHTIGLGLGGVAFIIVSAPPPGVELSQPPIPFTQVTVSIHLHFLYLWSWGPFPFRLQLFFFLWDLDLSDSPFPQLSWLFTSALKWHASLSRLSLPFLSEESLDRFTVASCCEPSPVSTTKSGKSFLQILLILSLRASWSSLRKKPTKG